MTSARPSARPALPVFAVITDCQRCGDGYPRTVTASVRYPW